MNTLVFQANDHLKVQAQNLLLNNYSKNYSTEAYSKANRSYGEHSEIGRDSQIVEFATELAIEAMFFCERVLGLAASQALVRAYISAHFKRPPHLLFDNGNVKKIIESKIDPVAIEFATRKGSSPLGYKLLLVCYLAENLPGFHDLFFCKSSSQLKSFALLFLQILKSPICFLKGKYLIWRYQLV